MALQGRWRAALAAGAMAGAMAGAGWAGPMEVGGELQVGESGSVSYTVPVAVPPGTAGLEPKLAFSYHSQGGNGLLGVGWSLSGLSAVTRCPRTPAQDGVRGSIQFDANDRLCLDGQRLMLVSGSYGGDGAEYRTERDAFSKIVSYGSAGNGPERLKVWSKAGLILEYGATADARIEAQGKTSVRVWALNKVSDTKGNYFTVTYTEDTANGDYVPARIDYTGNAGLAPNASVRFVYEARPDSVPAYYAGSVLKSTQRLKTLATYVGESPVREYRLAYGTSGWSGRSRLASLTECEMTGATCKPPVSFTWSDFGANAFNASSQWSSGVFARYVADVNGDGRADFINTQADGVYVALSTGSGAGTVTRWINAFGTSQGYSDRNVNPVNFVDLNGDGLADVIGFKNDGVYVALSNGTQFAATPSKWSSEFGSDAAAGGWSSQDVQPRTLADMNGDGRPDLVGFKSDGVYVALHTGTGFAAATRWLADFGSATARAYPKDGTHPRMVADVNGDGFPDVVGFASDGVYVALNAAGSGLGASTQWVATFGINQGWSDQNTYMRSLGDVNGDGLPDIVGFAGDGVRVSLNTGTSFQPPPLWLSGGFVKQVLVWGDNSQTPRMVADVNGDGKADVVGFGMLSAGVQVALSTGNSFGAITKWVDGFTATFAGDYANADSNPRQLADVTGDGFPDVVGALNGTNVATSGKAVAPDLVTGVNFGLGASAAVTYKPLTDSSVYTKGTGAAWPVLDLQMPMYVAATLKAPNGLGGVLTTNYQYGTLRADITGRGLLGFGWVQSASAETGVTVRTDYRQDWPYLGLPGQVKKTLAGAGNNGVLGLVSNTYACLNPASGTACTVGAGNRYFPYLSQSVESSWDLNGAALPTVTTTNAFDNYGNATTVTVSASDGYSKSTTNTYTNDTTNWLLGRLTGSTVTSTAP